MAGATAGPQLPPTAPGAHHHAVLERAASAVTLAFHSQQEVRVKLSPPELGTLQVNVFRQDGNVLARIESQSSATHQLLLDNLHDLRDSLAQQGIPVQQIDVTFNDQAPGQQHPSGFASHSFQQHGQPPQQQQQAPPRQQPEFFRPPRPAPNTAGGAPPAAAGRGPNQLKQLDVKI
jgi:flagellar hook-length control protein FliK